jgi:hypothetical protein
MLDRFQIGLSIWAFGHDCPFKRIQQTGKPLHPCSKWRRPSSQGAFVQGGAKAHHALLRGFLRFGWICPKISLTSKINLFGQASRKISSILFREIRCWQYDAVTCWKGIVIAMPLSHASPLVFAAKLPSVSQVFAFLHSASSDLSACTCGVLEAANAWPSLSKEERGFARVVQTW